MTRAFRLSALLVAAALAGCATVDIDQQLATTNQEAAAFTGGQLALARTDEQRAQQQAAADRLLAAPLGQPQAVQLALAGSPAVQAAIAQRWAEAATAAQSARLANPMFSFERMRGGPELELTRTLSFGLFELLTLPARAAQAERRIAASQVQLTASAVDQVTQVRQTWVRAVAAQQSLGYARQVQASAEVSAELARRMQAVGNWNRLTRARQQLFYADATTQLALAEQHAASARAALVRLLGLDAAQAARLQLPERLPDLPDSPRGPEEVSAAARAARLDLQLARTAYETAAKEQGLNRLTSLTDIELGVRHDTVFDDAAGSRDNREGYEISVRLPLFDWGEMQRDAMNARTLAAANQLEAAVRAAGSNLREAYAAYRTAWDVCHHYRDEVLPLRRVIAEENLLRYNGMLIGVFELLADTRDQVHAVIAAIEAQRDFWLADGALQAAIIGKPTEAPAGVPPASAGSPAPADH